MPTTRRSADEWRVIVEEWLASGQSKEVYARMLGVSPITLGWWRWKLGAREEAGVAEQVKPAFAEVVLVEPDDEAPAAREAPDFVLEMGGDLRVRVSPGFDGPELRRLLAVLC